jgi:CheY-like chemotaxis protein
MRNKPLILVVDDEGSFLDVITTKLKAAGFDTATARSATEGIKATEELLPDLVLMDIYLPPGQNGADAAITLKQNPKTKDVKIAFLSGLKDPWPSLSGDKKAVCKELGMEDFWEKTEDLNELLEKTKALLAKDNG